MPTFHLQNRTNLKPAERGSWTPVKLALKLLLRSRKLYNVQGDQLNMTVFFWYIVESDLSRVRHCTRYTVQVTFSRYKKQAMFNWSPITIVYHEISLQITMDIIAPFRIQPGILKIPRAVVVGNIIMYNTS